MKNYFFKLNQLIWDQGFELRLAETKEEFEHAFKLLHDCYVGQGVIDPTPSGLYCKAPYFLPESSVIIAKYRGAVVGAVVLTRDSSLVFGAELYYPLELSQLRRRGSRLVESSVLAISKHFRNKDAIVAHLLMKYIYLYSSRYLGASHVIMQQHPKRCAYFTKYWQMQKMGAPLQYQSTDQGQTQLLVWPLTAEQLIKITMSYNSPNLQKNLGVFLNLIDERFKFPNRRVGQIVDLVMTPALLEHFFLNRTQLFEELDLKTRKLVLETYVQLYGPSRMAKFLQFDHSFRLREFRMPVLTQSGIRAGHQFGIGKILDISSNGCFVQIPSQLEDTFEEFKDEITLSFKIGEKTYEAKAHILWNNKGHQTRYPRGLGVQFTQPIETLKQEFNSWVQDFDYIRQAYFST